jgi:hypothetical protein
VVSSRRHLPGQAAARKPALRERRYAAAQPPAAIAISIGARTIRRGSHYRSEHAGPGRSTPLTSASALQPAGATGFDPLTSPAADPGNENSQDAKYAIDSSLQSSWTSQWYASADFGRLKAGSGLLIDMGKQVKLATVTVTFNSQPGASVKLRVGNSAARSEQNLDSMTTVASAQSPTGHLPYQGPADGAVPGGLVHEASAQSRGQR